MEAIERLLYGFPDPAPHKRTKPVQVLCLGLPRTGTESLSMALQKLGLDTYHGWDLVFEPDGSKIQHCRNLVKRKYHGVPSRDGDVQISSADFDILIGDKQAVIDSLSVLFAPELVAAYPDAKVVLNVRRDLDAWHRSINGAIGQTADRSWVLWYMRSFCAEMHWLGGLYFRYGFPAVFRSVNGSAADGIERNAKWVYRDHYNMVRGMVPRGNLLEYSIEDGWEPLCQFLDVPVPDEPFPRVNNQNDFVGRRAALVKWRFMRALRNTFLTAVVFGGITTAGVIWWQGRIPEVTSWLRESVGTFTKRVAL